MEAPNPTDPSQTICFPTSERKPAFSTRSGFCIDFGSRLGPFWHHFEVEMGKKNKKIASETASKNNNFFYGFLIPFLTILVSILTPQALLFRTPDLPKSYMSPRMGNLGPPWPFCSYSWFILSDLGSKIGALEPIWEAFLRIWGTIFDTSIQVPCSRFRFRFRILNQISRFKIQDSKFKIQDSRFKIQSKFES